METPAPKIAFGAQAFDPQAPLETMKEDEALLAVNIRLSFLYTDEEWDAENGSHMAPLPTQQCNDEGVLEILEKCAAAGLKLDNTCTQTALRKISFWAKTSKLEKGRMREDYLPQFLKNKFDEAIMNGAVIRKFRILGGHEISTVAGTPSCKAIEMLLGFCPSPVIAAAPRPEPRPQPQNDVASTTAKVTTIGMPLRIRHGLSSSLESIPEVAEEQEAEMQESQPEIACSPDAEEREECDEYEECEEDYAYAEYEECADRWWDSKKSRSRKWRSHKHYRNRV